MTIKLTGNFKKGENWRGSIDSYLQVGDFVDEDIYNHFVNVLPPVRMTSNLVQLGEVYFHDENGYATFPTITKIEGRWVYCGNCHIGNIENIECPY